MGLFLKLLGGFLLLNQSLAFANCIEQSMIGYVTSVDRSHVVMYAHRHNDQLTLLRCSSNHQRPCVIVVKGSKSQLCSNEKINGRVKRGLARLVSGFATGGLDTADFVLKEMIHQARLNPECPATEVFDRITQQQSVETEILTYFEIAGRFDLVPNFRKLASVNVYGADRIQMAFDFFANRVGTDFSNDQSFEGMTSPFLPNMTTSSDPALINQYCSLF